MTKLTFLISLALILSTASVAADLYEEPFNPLKEKKISIIKLENMNKVAEACNIGNPLSNEYWPLTESFVQLLDSLVNKQLQALDYKPSFNKAIHKQYLGIQIAENNRLVYVFVYPEPSRVIKKEQGNPVLLCRKNAREKIIFAFDKNTNHFEQVML